MKPLVVADIGGTNARFAVATVADDGAVALDYAATFPTREYDSFDACIARYLSRARIEGPVDACLAAAGPAVDNAVSMTNLGWRVDGAALTGRFGLDRVHVVNDFVAMAWSTSVDTQLDLLPIRPGEARQGVRLVLGPGTGLGVCALVPVGDGWLEVPGEGGHVRCPAWRAFPESVWEQLRAWNPGLYVELVLSGRGMENLHAAMLAVSRSRSSASSAVEITASAVREADAMSVRTARVFCDLLGCAARDFALTFGALGGVYLAGGILPRLREQLLGSAFADHFVDHPTYRDYLSAMPVSLIQNGQAAMLGAARWFRQRVG
ncbi:MAG: glucokinase [Pseudomonadota bacterium]